MSKKEIFDKLRDGLLAYDKEAVEKAANNALKE